MNANAKSYTRLEMTITDETDVEILKKLVEAELKRITGTKNRSQNPRTVHEMAKKEARLATLLFSLRGAWIGEV